MKSAPFRKGLAVAVLAAGLLTIRPAPGAGAVEWRGGLWTGYRQDRLDFNIAGNTSGSNPNILSELIWKDLEIWQAGVQGSLRFLPRHSPVGGLVRLQASFGIITDGRNQDSDYLGDDRSGEFSRSNNDADGEVWDVSLGAGPQFFLSRDRLRLTPMIGVAIHAQDLEITNGYQSISQPTEDMPLPPLGSFSGLHSSYNALWTGPWTGVELQWQPLPGLLLTGGAELHLVYFTADGDWNLRQDFSHPKSFEQQAWGEGFQGRAGLAYLASGRWIIQADYFYRRWQADDDGRDRVFFADGSTSETRLNEVNWRSQTLTLGVNYRF